MELKIGRNNFQIDEDDIFMDNGACIQLITQPISKGFRSYNPVLSKSAEKTLKSMPHTKVRAEDKLTECYYIQLKFQQG